MTVKLRSSGWEIGGETLPWLWGGIHYWDIERYHWREVLRTYQRSGHQVVATAVLPRIHQIGPGKFEFGPGRPQYDLTAFLTEAQEIGLKTFLWIGPREVPGSAAAGYPEELLTDEEALARGPEGNWVLSRQGFGGEIFSLPSLVSKKIAQALTPFAEGLYKVLHPFIHPDGPVIGIGLTQAPGWRWSLAAFSADYHPEAIYYYQTFLKKRYTRITDLNQAYATRYKAFTEINPPRLLAANSEFPEAGLLDWAQFKEEYFIRAAEQLYNIFSKLSCQRIPILLETLPTLDRPNNLVEMEHLRCFDYVMPGWPLKPSPFTGQPGFLSLVHPLRFFTWGQAPFTSPASEDSHALELFKSMAEGVRAWEALSASGAGNFLGFITDRQGMLVRPHHPLWESLQENFRTEGFLHSQLYGEVVLISLPEFEYAAYLETPAEIRWDLLDQTPQTEKVIWDPFTLAFQEQYAQLEKFLVRAQFPFFKASGNIPVEKLVRYPLLIVPGAQRMSPGSQALIARWLEEGKYSLIVGPLPPHPETAKHLSLKELSELKPKRGGKSAQSKAHKSGRLFHQPEFSETTLLRLFQQLGIQRPVIFDHPELQVTFHQLKNRRFVAAVNLTSNPIETFARREGKFVLKDFWTNTRFFGGNNEIKVTIPAQSVKYWELIPC